MWLPVYRGLQYHCLGWTRATWSSSSSRVHGKFMFHLRWLLKFSLLLSSPLEKKNLFDKPLGAHSNWQMMDTVGLAISGWGVRILDGAAGVMVLVGCCLVVYVGGFWFVVCLCLVFCRFGVWFVWHWWSLDNVRFLASGGVWWCSRSLTLWRIVQALVKSQMLFDFVCLCLSWVALWVVLGLFMFESCPVCFGHYLGRGITLSLYGERVLEVFLRVIAFAPSMKSLWFKKKNHSTFICLYI